MLSFLRTLCLFTVAVLSAWGTPGAVLPARGEIAFEASWNPPDYQSVRKDVSEWLAEAKLDEEVAESVRDLWPREGGESAEGSELLDRAAKSFALAYPEAAALQEACSETYEGPDAPDGSWLRGDDAPEFVRHNLRVFYARWLAQHGLYDEVLDQVADLQPGQVIDPVSLLFYQAAAYHQLVRPDEARAALAMLLEHREALPRRYRQIAELVERDLSSLEDESLDHIARRMRDVRRRLNYGRAGEKVQTVEQGVLDSLDKKIEDLEKKQQQQQQSASSSPSGGSSKSSKPMDDSRMAELKAPMQVDQRDIGDKSGWGDMPPKERERALQQIGRDYPAHYRELIEEYFRELANEPTQAAGPMADDDE